MSTTSVSMFESIEINSDEYMREDTFDDSTNVVVYNCDVLNGEIILMQTSDWVIYDFSNQTNHKAYAYLCFFFLPFTQLFSPTIHLNKEIELDTNEIWNLKQLDYEYVSRSSTALRKMIVYHFRFYIDIDANSINRINFNWYGKADTNAVINFYYWNSSRFLRGSWGKLGRIQSNGDEVSVAYILGEGAIKYAIDSNNYLDISVVAYYPLMFKSCMLLTDYINLIAQLQDIR